MSHFNFQCSETLRCGLANPSCVRDGLWHVYHEVQKWVCRTPRWECDGWWAIGPSVFFGKNAHFWMIRKIYNFPEICTCATKLTPTFWGSSLFYFFNAVCSLFWSAKFVRFHTLNNCIFVGLVCSHKTNKHQSNCCIESHPGYVLESLGSYRTLIEAPPSPRKGLETAKQGGNRF